MTIPRRLIDELEQLSAPEKRALEAARGDRPRAEFVDGVFTSLLARIPPLGPGGGDGGGSTGPGVSSASSGTSTAVGATGATGGAGALGGAGATGAAGALGGAFGAAGAAGAFKAAALGAMIGALVLAGRAALVPAPSALARTASAEVASTIAPEDGPRTPTPAHAGAQLEPSRTRVETRDPLPTETPSPASLAAGARPSDPSGNGSESRGQTSGRSSREPGAFAGNDGPLASSGAAAEDPLQETRLVGAAREALRRDDWRAAAGLLELARQRFPRGILLQEREALAIEALVQSGQRSLASERAQAFFRAYPASPHAARVRAVVAGP